MLSESEESELLALLEEDDAETAADKAIGSLSEFVHQAWFIVEPGTERIPNWHLDIICTALERQIQGEPEYRKLLICVPPGSMKSLLVSVFAPAWEWLRRPERRKIFLANDDALAVRDSRRTRQIITSDWYRLLLERVAQQRGEKPWTLSDDQNQKVNFENTRRGFRQCLSIGAAVTGKRADDIVIDDPIDAKAVVNGSGEQVAKRLQEVANVVDKVLPSRVNNLAQARWTVIMQRLHENDTAGRALKEGDWHVVNIQMEFEPGNPLNHPDDPRKTAGELMFPALFPREEIDKLKAPNKLGLRHYSAQYQQQPKPNEGTYILRAYFAPETRYKDQPLVNTYIASDYAVSLPQDGREPDYSEHGVFGVGPDDGLYVLDWWYGQTKSDEWTERLLDLVEKWKPLCYFGEAGVIQKAVEPSLTKRMRERRVYCRTEWIPSMTDKAARGRPFQARAAMKKVHFPQSAPWAERVIEQCVDFPGGTHDDAFDTMGLICRVIDQAHPAIVRKVETKKKDPYSVEENSSNSWKVK